MAKNILEIDKAIGDTFRAFTMLLVEMVSI